MPEPTSTRCRKTKRRKRYGRRPDPDQPTLYRIWIGELVRRFGARRVKRLLFEPPFEWTFERWRARRVMGAQD